MDSKQIETITSEAIDFFGLNAEKVYWLKIENGLKYLEKHFEQDPSLVEPLLKHPEFWLWWRELWALRDQTFMKMCERKMYGYRYTYPIGRMIEVADGKKFQPTDSVQIYTKEAWDFYCSIHHIRNVKFYPNHILINKCLENQSINNLTSNNYV
jgi:hypothetical protein